MELILAIAIGVLGGSGVWLVLRPRTFQVLMGLSLLSYAVNLFIFAMGSLFHDREPIVQPGLLPNLEHYTDPLPQALVLTAIVIGFATSALFLVVLLASRGLSDTDHVDGEEPRDGTGHVSIGSAAASPSGSSDEGRSS
ncbi:Na+/H+ antiporter subunit C [Ottowia testudinis]|uniref:Na+/H+ antiporter subunit C n=1 Tax=Ottowia testudinis TaxID=2816950 RepID=A0A975CJK4_9BURK|nr:Na+/H+ antiporter subunit C [Ottowia testudinis]QTD46779.1 Na+/H+ antiporter subunit C [Ottowia testudinis]